MLELASELVGGTGWPYRQAKISLRSRTSEGWDLTLFASDSPEGIRQMARGEVHLAIVNPGVILNLAIRGTGPFKEPVPVRAIAVMHSYDQFVLGVAGRTGLTSLEDIREKRYPLRVSLRADRNHSIHLVVDEVLKAAGFSLDRVRVHIDKKTGLNRQLAYLDPTGQPVVTMKYDDIQVNPELSDDFFVYTPKPGMPVRDMTGMMGGLKGRN